MSEAVLTILREKLTATLRSVADHGDVVRWLQHVPMARPLGFYSAKADGVAALDDIVTTLFTEDPSNLRAFLRDIYVEYAARDDARNGLRDCLRLLRTGEVRPQNGQIVADPAAPAQPFEFLQALREPLIPALVWLETLQKRMGQVCRISTKGHSPLGTGFLVGSTHVLTAGHVLLGLSKDEVAGLRFRFDYHQQQDGSYAPGTEVRCGSAGVLDSAPPGAGEVAKTADLPQAGDLDFALIHIDRPLGDERGTIPLEGTPEALTEDNGLTLLHFPDGGTMRATFDTDAFAADPVQGVRMHYANTSRPGSSGAPVLQSRRLTLVALHTYGQADPVNGMARGVPIWLLRDRVKNALQIAVMEQGVPA